jgi:hypothetical protein
LLWKVGFLKKLAIASRETGWGFRVVWLTERECCSKQKEGVLKAARLGHTGRANPSQTKKRIRLARQTTGLAGVKTEGGWGSVHLVRQVSNLTMSTVDIQRPCRI